MQENEFRYEEEKYITKEDFSKYLTLIESEDIAISRRDEKEMERLVHEFIGLILSHPKFIPPYESVIRLLRKSGEDFEALGFQDKAVKETLSIILNDKREFPESMKWLWSENRPLIRFLYQHAENCWENGQLDEAKLFYSELLRSNLYDNIGARYCLLGLLKGFEFERFNGLAFDETGYLMEGMVLWFELESKAFKEFDEFWVLAKQMEY